MAAWIAGVDEAGCGPLAGPVTAAAVVLPPEFDHPLVNDSKQLTGKLRERLFDEIMEAAVVYAIVSVGSHRVDRFNIRQATIQAHLLAMDRVSDRWKSICPITPQPALHFLIDGNLPHDTDHSHQTIIKGDSKVRVIGAASILAKVTRDRLMQLIDSKYPAYGFKKHKGYGTESHRQALKSSGPSPVHRRSFQGVVLEQLKLVGP